MFTIDHRMTRSPLTRTKAYSYLQTLSGKRLWRKMHLTQNESGNPQQENGNLFSCRCKLKASSSRIYLPTCSERHMGTCVVGLYGERLRPHGILVLPMRNTAFDLTRKVVTSPQTPQIIHFTIENFIFDFAPKSVEFSGNHKVIRRTTQNCVCSPFGI